MFGWFRPTCPVDDEAKEWIEERLQWLHDEFAIGPFTGGDVILPTPNFFPDSYDGSRQAVQALVERVCAYMEVSPDIVSLRFRRKKKHLGLVNEAGRDLPGEPAGTYQETGEGFVININESQFDRPMDLVGTTAHELAHLRLLGENRISRDVFDNELLTDLTVVYFGLGIFLANVPRHWDSGYSTWPGTELRKPEYMTGPMYSYALAHLAWFRGEEKPDWLRHLHYHARADAKQALHYLRKTQNSAFRPDGRAYFRDDGASP